jgi:pyruvate ferredoxin oxidoreductase gamma subunit
MIEIRFHGRGGQGAVTSAELLKVVNVAAGLKPEGILVTTSNDSPEKVKEILKIKNRLGVVDAVKIAREVLGLPITNTTMLGSLLKVSGLVKKESFIPPFKERFGRIAEKNISAFERAYQETILIQ